MKSGMKLGMNNYSHIHPSMMKATIRILTRAFQPFENARVGSESQLNLCLRLLIPILWLAVAGSASAQSPNGDRANLFVNGDIITLNDAQPTAEAVLVQNGRIKAIGFRDEVEKAAAGKADVVDLNGKTLMPGFIDSHSHVSLVGTKLALANMDNAPAGPISSIGDIRVEFLKWIKEKNLKPGDVVAGWGYDHTQLKEKRHPTRDDLDEISTEYPIVLIHFSTHQLVMNTMALELVGYDENTPDPEGGRILRRPGSKVPNGIAQEAASIPIKLKLFGADYEEKVKRLDEALDLYRAGGFTTAQDAAVLDTDWVDAYRQLGKDGRLDVDVVGIAYYKAADSILKNYENENQYHNHFRLGGVKIVLDGGSPGRSANLRDPYHIQLDGEHDYKGVAVYPNQKDVNEKIKEFYSKGWQTFIHALGDGAVDQAIIAVREAEKAYPQKERRTQLIHLQQFQPDQMVAVKALDATVTFQSAHLFYFGDFHREEIFGPERAERLVPAKSALDHGISVTLHHDAPVHPPNQLDLIWMAVNRVTRSGHVLGPAERLPVIEALKASTLYAAYQVFEEANKGSLEQGKLADFVVLSENPLKIDPMKIRDIQVLETIKEGKTVYRAAKP
jgi:predicted amidohydrolase YtcJ